MDAAEVAPSVRTSGQHPARSIPSDIAGRRVTDMGWVAQWTEETTATQKRPGGRHAAVFGDGTAKSRGLCRVPAIFVFLPDRWLSPAGRLFVGVLLLVGMAVLVMRVGLG
jgi:hypothetical protein